MGLAVHLGVAAYNSKSSPAKQLPKPKKGNRGKQVGNKNRASEILVNGEFRLLDENALERGKIVLLVEKQQRRTIVVRVY